MPGDHITVPSTREKFHVKQVASMSELRRLRRQFVTYTKVHPVDSQEGIARLFVTFLNRGVLPE